MKGYNHVCELAVCICLTGDEPCINYCYLQSQRLTLSFNSLFPSLTPPSPPFLFYIFLLFFFFLPQHSPPFISLPSFQFLSIHSLPHYHPFISPPCLACRPSVSNTSLTALNLSHPLLSSLLCCNPGSLPSPSF